YTVKAAAPDASAETTDATELAVKLDKGTPVAKLTSKQRSELIKQHKSAADMLDTIGKGLADGVEVGTATLGAKRSPSRLSQLHSRRTPNSEASMKRTRSHVRFTVPLALLVGASIATLPSTPVFAENWKDTASWVLKNGDIIIFSQDQDDS